MAQDRLQKILARAGVASRRHAEELIVSGRVRLNGRVVTELGTKADPKRDNVEVDGRRVIAEDFAYLVFHKPRGVVSTMSDPEGRLSVKEYLKDAPGRVYPIGRLDYATSGVLLATNDGDFADGLLHPRSGVPKTYVIKVKGQMKEKDLKHWSQGVELDDGITQPAIASMLRYEDDKTWLELTIKEGRNQQIRRMGEATGFPVMRLARTIFAGVTTEGLRPGTWRLLTSSELTTLKKAYGVPRAIPARAEHAPPSRAAGPKRIVAPSGRGRNKEREPERNDRPRAMPARGEHAPPVRAASSFRKRVVTPGGRGRNEREPEPTNDSARAELGRGRGVSRTTGTGGGIGANQDGAGYRMSRKRGS
jgi:23S rRNA pseudouridine2605 synthase